MKINEIFKRPKAMSDTDLHALNNGVKSGEITKIAIVSSDIKHIQQGTYKVHSVDPDGGHNPTIALYVNGSIQEIPLTKIDIDFKMSPPKEIREHHLAKGTEVTVTNTKKYNALAPDEVSGIIIGPTDSSANYKYIVKVGTGSMNVDPSDIVEKTKVTEEDPCWKGYKQIGMKKKGTKQVPNCVPEGVDHYVIEDADEIIIPFGKLEEAEYQGKSVELNKPKRGGSKKFYVYVKNDKGNVVKVSFGSPDMSIKKSNPDARKNFRARHNCDQKKDKTSAGYWSCRSWSDSESWV